MFFFCSIPDQGGDFHGTVMGRKMKDARRSVSRVLYGSITDRDGHSSGTCLATRLTRPTRTTGRKNPRKSGRGPFPVVPIRSCSRWGLPCRRCYQKRGALLPHRFTLTFTSKTQFPAAEKPEGGLFSVALSLRSPSPAVSRHRSSVEPGLSSPLPCGKAATVRPSGWRTLSRSHVSVKPVPVVLVRMTSSFLVL